MLILLTCLFIASCSCSDEEADGNISGKECEHYWDKGEIIKEATVTEYGKMSYTCLLCEEKREEAIPKKAHSHEYTGEWKSDRMYHWHDCSIDGCTVKGDKGSHTWSEKILVESNPTTTGKKLLTCTACALEKEEDYRARATVTEAEFNRAVSPDSFKNVTVKLEMKQDGVLMNLEYKIANGYMQIDQIEPEDKEDDGLGSNGIAKQFRSIKYADLTYDEATRAYFCEIDGVAYTLQFADGNVYLLVVKAEYEAKYVFTSYGRTEITGVEK